MTSRLRNAQIRPASLAPVSKLLVQGDAVFGEGWTEAVVTENPRILHRVDLRLRSDQSDPLLRLGISLRRQQLRDLADDLGPRLRLAGEFVDRRQPAGFAL